MWHTVSASGARVSSFGAARPRSVVLLLHGGNEAPDLRPVPAWWPPVLRLWLLAVALRAPHRRICLLRYSARGWDTGRVDDLRWALDRISGRYPASRVIAVGHSLGGRLAVRGAVHGWVDGAVALAAWLPADEPARR